MHCTALPCRDFPAVVRAAAILGAVVCGLSPSIGCRREPQLPAALERTFAEQLADVRTGRGQRIVVVLDPVTDDDLATMGDVPHLVHLELPRAAVSDRGLEALRSAPRLEVLVLGDTTATNDGLAIIAELSELRRVNLPQTDADDAGLARLTTLPRLESLRIGGSRLTDAGLASLAAAKSLRFLILRNAPITDAGLKHLAPLAQLESLYLDGTQVTAEGERYLAETRPDLHVHFP